MQIHFTDSKGNHHSFRLAPGVTTEDGTGEAIPSALDGLDAYDRHRLALLVQAALDLTTPATPGGEDDE